ncbi:MAG TPA: HAD-IA family hydrolase [Fulvivirga sp.]|nr:HAD-IA family hydrolase [Fulvivirga sp.]
MKKGLENIETLIFDFDGTIADTLDLGHKIANSLSGKFKFKKINGKEELDYYRNMSTQEAIKAVGVSYLKLPFVAAAFKKRLAQNIDQLNPIDGIPEVIKELAKHYDLGILTSNSKSNVKDFLSKHGLTDCFQYIATDIGVFRKKRSILSMIKTYTIDARKTVLIGDETRDIEAAKKCELPIISVSWGFHTRDNLKSHEPNYIIDNPLELLTLLNVQ